MHHPFFSRRRSASSRAASRALSRWAATAAVGFFALSGIVGACNGDPEPDEREDEPDDEDPWNVGYGGGGGADPIYEEEGDPPDELRLKFQRIDVAQSGGATDMVFLPNKTEILMTLRDGGLLHLNFSEGETSVLGKWPFLEEMISNGACGPTNVVLDPDFVDNDFIYVSYCVDDAVTQLVRYEFSRTLGPISPAVIFETELEEPLDYWHRFGSMGFEEDGVLWFLLGEHFHPDFAQDIEGPYGGLHRIVPNREKDGDGYTPASGNMEMGMGGAGSTLTPFPSRYAYGLRSPWRGTRDSHGRYFVADVGHASYEEVNIIDEPGLNFGWPIVEGPCQADCEGFTDPVAFFTRSADDPLVTEDPYAVDASRRAIWLGEIYENPAIDRYENLMDDVVIYGDLFSGGVRALRVDQGGDVTMNRAVGHLEGVTQWRLAPDGYAYALDLSGQIYVALLEREL